jgi:hypothetical protein
VFSTPVYGPPASAVNGDEIVTVAVSVAVLEALSVTVSVTVYVPVDEYVYVGFCCVLIPPSPKFQL